MQLEWRFPFAVNGTTMLSSTDKIYVQQFIFNSKCTVIRNEFIQLWNIPGNPSTLIVRLISFCQVCWCTSVSGIASPSPSVVSLREHRTKVNFSCRKMLLLQVVRCHDVQLCSYLRTQPASSCRVEASLSSSAPMGILVLQFQILFN